MTRFSAAGSEMTPETITKVKKPAFSSILVGRKMFSERDFPHTSYTLTN